MAESASRCNHSVFFPVLLSRVCSVLRVNGCTMLEHHPDLTASVIYGLGWLYLLLFLMNAVWVWRSYHKDGEVRIAGTQIPVAAIWALYAACSEWSRLRI